MSKILNALATVIAIGLVVKMSIIGYYDNELPALIVAALVVLVLFGVAKVVDRPDAAPPVTRVQRRP